MLPIKVSTRVCHPSAEKGIRDDGDWACQCEKAKIDTCRINTPQQNAKNCVGYFVSDTFTSTYFLYLVQIRPWGLL